MQYLNLILSSYIGKYVEASTMWHAQHNIVNAKLILTQDGKEYLAETCIVTLPSGVLKAGSVKFEPKLPDWKTTAIKKIGFGLLNKVALRFETAFWYQPSEPGEEKDSDYVCRVTANRGDYYMFLSLKQCTGAPILVAMCAGECAEEIEKMADSYIVEKAVKALNDMYPASKDVRLISYKVTRWRADEHARGSYSYAQVGTTPKHFKDMARPVGETLRFAGEATIVEHMATAHGAYMTGCREAAQIIRESTLPPSLIQRAVQQICSVQNPHFGHIQVDSKPTERAQNSRKARSIHRQMPGKKAREANANSRGKRKRAVESRDPHPNARRSVRRKSSN